METAKIFNAIYSDVSEDIKNAVLDMALYEMGPELSFTMLTEDYSDGLSEMLTDYVDIIAHNAVSEEDLDEALEQVLEAVDTDTINIIAESFMDREVRRALFEREETINELFGFGKKSEERQRAEDYLKTTKASLAKAQADNASELKGIKAMQKRNSSPIGLSGIRQYQAAKDAEDHVNKIINTHKGEVAGAKADLNAIKAKERREAIDKVKGAAKSVWGKFTGAIKKGAEAVKNKAIETKDRAVETTKKAVAAGAGAVAKGATKIADVATKVKTAAETPKVATTPTKAQTITKTKAELEAQRKIHQNNLKDTGLSKKQLAYQQKALDKINAQLSALKEEALEEVTHILISSNISESTFEEIMEKLNSLKITPEGVAKAGAKREAEVEKSLNDMEKTMERGGKVTPEQAKRAEGAAAKLNKLKDRFKEYAKVNSL